MSAGWISDEERTVVDLLHARLESDPDGPYLDVTGTPATAAEVADVAGRLAGALIALGVGPGDRVATLVENSPEAMLSWWGVVLAGAVAVPVNTAYKGEYLRHQLQDSGSRALIVEASLVERAAPVVAQIEGLDHVIVVGSTDHRPVVVGGASEPVAGATVHRWEDLLAGAEAPPPPAVRPAALATFVYTGGTTGPSKGCMLSHRYHEVLARQIGVCWRRTNEPE